MLLSIFIYFIQEKSDAKTFIFRRREKDKKNPFGENHFPPKLSSSTLIRNKFRPCIGTKNFYHAKLSVSLHFRIWSVVVFGGDFD